MTNKDEYSYVSQKLSVKQLEKWVKENEPWRLDKDDKPEPIKLTKLKKGDNMINLGDELQDTVSVFKGIATARHRYLQCCDII